ncbi:paREP10 [Pyrobaculum neutrophilum V24Sta]|uniref:PaREP10 n=1 Tax=Pyrobaculum neutrophilum (strain DSM 2338 / JCM 9278 / NBRC 100436 / V24Sta) TaxID=444157 RepID=B1Y8Q6_PYRNV|nr:paREP10 [Pyrobaculum neutrophilum V24Sta]
MCVVFVVAVIHVLGVHAYSFVRYGVDPHDDVETAVKKLEAKAPHLAQFLREASYYLH